MTKKHKQIWGKIWREFGHQCDIDYLCDWEEQQPALLLLMQKHFGVKIKFAATWRAADELWDNNVFAKWRTQQIWIREASEKELKAHKKKQANICKRTPRNSVP